MSEWLLLIPLAIFTYAIIRDARIIKANKFDPQRQDQAKQAEELWYQLTGGTLHGRTMEELEQEIHRGTVLITNRVNKLETIVKQKGKK